MKIRLILVEPEEIFMQKLEDYILSNNVNFEIITFTANKFLMPYLQKHDAEILLIDDSSYSPELESMISKRTVKIIFSGKKEFAPFPGWNSIYKYQRMKDILQELSIIYNEVTGTLLSLAKENKKTKLLAFYSPIGGSGKTTLALGCALSLLKMNVKVFYLNFEKISSTNAYLKAESTQNMSDIFVSLMRRENVSYKIQSAKLVDQFSRIEYINPPNSELEISELDRTSVLNLINSLVALNEYDFVLIDLSSDFSVYNMVFLEKCDLIIAPVTSGVIPLYKINDFFKELQQRHDMIIPDDKIIVVLNKHEEAMQKPALGVPIQFTVPYLVGIQDTLRLREFYGVLDAWVSPLAKSIMQRLFCQEL